VANSFAQYGRISDGWDMPSKNHSIIVVQSPGSSIVTRHGLARSARSVPRIVAGIQKRFGQITEGSLIDNPMVTRHSESIGKSTTPGSYEVIAQGSSMTLI
jgi:hypothetical protein